MRTALDSWRTTCEPGAEGYLGGTYGFTDDGMFVAVVRFESKELAQRNSERPEQGTWWAETERLFESPPEFLDCADVLVILDGGSDDAGFVQIMRGRLTDRQRAKQMVRDTESALREARPDVIGATLAIADDDTFVQTVAFASEAEARKGEQQEMPADVREEMDAVMTVDSYLDLHHPFFATRQSDREAVS
jgi:hypothetical protein